MAGFIKLHFPKSKLYFLGRNYTKDVVALCEHVDEFINYDEIEKLTKKEQIALLKKTEADVFLHVFPKKEIAYLVKQCGIPLRIGTYNRLYHWFTCNLKVVLSRKNSDLHEAQLNLKLLNFLGVPVNLTLTQITDLYGFKKIPTLEQSFYALIDKNKFNVILHPKSKGSAREWGLDNFQKLIQLLPENKFKVFISGTEDDGKKMFDFISENPKVTDLTGKLSLNEFISFINACDGLVAASTGPLHISAAVGKVSVGLFAPMRPIHPGRWQPLGKNAHYLVLNKSCEVCRKSQNCHCIRDIKPEQVVALLNKT